MKPKCSTIASFAKPFSESIETSGRFIRRLPVSDYSLYESFENIMISFWSCLQTTIQALEHFSMTLNRSVIVGH